MENKDKVVLDSQEITREELEEKKKNLNGSQRIVESSPNNFVTLQRMND